MSSKTLFFVQPYVEKRHKLVASGALTFRDDAEAIEVGATMARRRAGVVVLSQTYDSQKHNLSRPVVLRVHGRVPGEWAEVSRAA